MNQPPNSRDSSLVGINEAGMPTASAAEQRPPDWQRPEGVAPGTWDYVHQRSIAHHYDAFVAGVAMESVESQILRECFPGVEMGDTKTILDLGCGTGRTAIPLAKSGYEVVAIDLSQSMLDELAGKARKESLERIYTVRANLVQMEFFRDNVAEGAVCLFSTLGMIQGRSNRQAMLKHVARMIRPGGTLLIHVHHRWAALREPQGLRKTAMSWLRSKRDPDHELGDSTYAYRGLERMFMHRFGRRELEQDLRQTGWQVIRLERLSIDGKTLTGCWPIAGGFFVLARNAKDG
ncbi:class I SAM-dependent methyltransferase [Rubripirellula amarantea]|nr:class I SAM-dependent methyltransferase [Rubripirellula amarantea]